QCFSPLCSCRPPPHRHGPTSDGTRSAQVLRCGCPLAGDLPAALGRQPEHLSRPVPTQGIRLWYHGIAAYKISPEAKNTVLLWKEGTVRHNFVDVNRASFPAVVKAVDEMLK